MNRLRLTGLDGSNPLAYLAALGTLDVLARVDGPDAVRLSWVHDGVWLPVLHTARTLDEVIAALDAHRATSVGRAAFALTYQKVRAADAEAKAQDDKVQRDLKPSPTVLRAYLAGLVGSARPSDRLDVDLAAAFASELVQDGGGAATKPTAFHFTAGQQQFLGIVDEVARAAGPDDLREALVGPWKYCRLVSTLAWDCTATRAWALRARNPSTEKRASVPGADWLAVIGLTLFPVVADGDRLVTPGFSGGWKAGDFTWALWSGPLGRDATYGLVRAGGLAGASTEVLAARGVAVVFRSAVTRTDQGGYGSFGPAVVVA